MMNFVKLRLFAFMLIITTVMISGYHLSADNNVNIIVYGTKVCGLCAAMERNLNLEKIPYVFHDLNADESKNRGMWGKLTRQHGNMKNVRLPIMEIDGKIYISPKFTEVKALFASSRKDTGKDLPSGENICTDSTEGDIPVIYGISPSQETRDMCLSLIDAGIHYKYINLKKSTSLAKELSEKIASQFPGRKNIQFPIVLVRGKLLISPSSEEVKRLIEPADTKEAVMQTKPVRPGRINKF
jgi:arsenate reductase-like glutaredoxin family protein